MRNRPPGSAGVPPALPGKKVLKEQEKLDDLVVAQADDADAWGKPVQVQKKN